jgi:hypothetical protein
MWHRYQEPVVVDDCRVAVHEQTRLWLTATSLAVVDGQGCDHATVVRIHFTQGDGVKYRGAASLLRPGDKAPIEFLSVAFYKNNGIVEGRSHWTSHWPRFRRWVFPSDDDTNPLPMLVTYHAIFQLNDKRMRDGSGPRIEPPNIAAWSPANNERDASAPRERRCADCGTPGHNARTCPSRTSDRDRERLGLRPKIKVKLRDDLFVRSPSGPARIRVPIVDGWFEQPAENAPAEAVEVKRFVATLWPSLANPQRRLFVPTDEAGHFLADALPVGEAVEIAVDVLAATSRRSGIQVHENRHFGIVRALEENYLEIEVFPDRLTALRHTDRYREIERGEGDSFESLLLRRENLLDRFEQTRRELYDVDACLFLGASELPANPEADESD